MSENAAEKDARPVVTHTPGGRLVKHGGSGTAYANFGCRCSECTAANTRRVDRRKKQRIAMGGLPPGVEHGRSAYGNWGCRCEVCTEANKAGCRAYYRAHRATASDVPDRHATTEDNAERNN